MIRLTAVALILAFSVLPIASAEAAIAGKVAKELIEATVDRAARRSGRAIDGTAARKAAIEEVGRLAEAHGSDVLKVVEDSGLELLEAIPTYGDELVQIAAKVSPQARRALALNVSELLPLTRRVGVEAIELEAKAPGQASNVFRIFGDDAGKTVATTVRTEDLPRIIKYGEKSDSDATRQLLLEAYEKEGASLFERIPPGLVLATGLSASMLYGTHEVTAPARAEAEALRENPDIIRDVMNHSTTVWGGIGLVVILILLWRFGLMPWQRSQRAARKRE
jgi:hypothetical protein